MAAQLWPGQDPIGKRVRTGGMDATPDAPWMTVVGVVGRVKQEGLDTDPRMAMHLAHSQVADPHHDHRASRPPSPRIGRRGRARRDSRDRPGSADLQRADHGRRGRRVARVAPILDAAVDPVRVAGARPRRRSAPMASSPAWSHSARASWGSGWRSARRPARPGAWSCGRD